MRHTDSLSATTLHTSPPCRCVGYSCLFWHNKELSTRLFRGIAQTKRPLPSRFRKATASLRKVSLSRLVHGWWMNSRHSSHRALVEELWRFSCRVRRGARCLAPTATEPSSDSRCEGEHPRSGAVRSPHQPRECSAAAATRFAVRLLTGWRNLTTGPAVKLPVFVGSSAALILLTALSHAGVPAVTSGTSHRRIKGRDESSGTNGAY